jgi:hypothetical protein
MRQRATMAILAALVALPAFAAFTDVPGQHWAKSAVEAATSGNQPIMTAAKDGKFHGEQAVTHAEEVKAFNQMLVYIAQHTTAKFDLAALKTNNPGWNAVKDNSTKPLTRYELAGIMSGLYTQAQAKGIVEAKPGAIKFSDLDKAPAWAKEAVKNVVDKYGIMKGYPDGKFHGEKAVTRYELAALTHMMLGSDWRPISERPTPKPTATATPKPTPTPEPTVAPTPVPTPTAPIVTFPAYRLDVTAFGIPGLPGLTNFAPNASDATATIGALGTPFQYNVTFKGRQDIGDFFIGEKIANQPGIFTDSVSSIDGALQLGWNLKAGDYVRFRPYVSGGAMYNGMFGQSAATGFSGRDTLIPHAGYGLVFDAKILSWLGFSLDVANKHAISAMNLGGTGTLPGTGAMMPSANAYIDLYPTDNFGISLGYGFLGLPDMKSTTGSNILLQHGPNLGLFLAF